MMTFEQIMAVIVASAPSITAIIGCIVTFFKNKATCNNVVNKFEAMRQEVFNTKQYDELKS